MKRKKKSIWCIPVLIFLPLAVFSMKICDNGIDDDNDGLIDLNDSNCDCESELGAQQFIINGDFANIPDLGWGGSKKQQPLYTGTFSYIVEMELVNGDTEKSIGDISVIN